MSLNVDYIDQELNMWNVGVTAIVRVALQDGSSHENVGFAESKKASKGEAMLDAKRVVHSNHLHRSVPLIVPVSSVCSCLAPILHVFQKKSLNVCFCMTCREVKPSLVSSSTSSKDSSQTADFTLHSQSRPVEKVKDSVPKPDAPSPIVLKPYQGEVPVKEMRVPETKALETVTAEDMMGLEDIDLSNIAMEYSPKEMQPAQSAQSAQSAQPAQPAQAVAQQSIPSMQSLQPSTMQSIQQPTVQSIHSPTLTKPPIKPQQQFQNGMPLRNQAMLQGLQQGAGNRGPNGLPLVRPPVNGVPSIGTVQNNAFSMKRNAPFISFLSTVESPLPNVMPVSKR